MLPGRALLLSVACCPSALGALLAPLPAAARVRAPMMVVTSWYDSGVRLASYTPPAAAHKAMPPPPAPLPPPPPPLTASAEASLAAAAISAVAVLGIDLASFGVVENLDAAVLVGGLALSQVEARGPIGDALRAVGNATSGALGAVGGVFRPVGRFWADNEVGLTSRAVLELGLENAIYALDPKRRKAEKAAATAEAAAAAAATLRAERDAVPIFSLQDRWAMDEEVREAERAASEAKRAAQAAYKELARDER